MDRDDMIDIMETAVNDYRHIIAYQTAFELKGLSEGLSAYGLTIDDVQIFMESDILPEKLLY